MRLPRLPILDIGSDPADDPDLVVRKRTAVGTLLALWGAGLGYALMGILAGCSIPPFDNPGG